jgi:hypothetical protein
MLRLFRTFVPPANVVVVASQAPFRSVRKT